MKQTTLSRSSSLRLPEALLFLIVALLCAPTAAWTSSRQAAELNSHAPRVTSTRDLPEETFDIPRASSPLPLYSPSQGHLWMALFAMTLFALTLVAALLLRRRGLAELRLSEERFRSIVDSNPMGIHLYRLEKSDQLTLVVANPAADSLLGIEHRPLIGMAIEKAFPALAGGEEPRRYRQVCKAGESYQRERVEEEGGEIRRAYQVHAFQTGPGRMARVFTDITERKRAERQSVEISEFNEKIIHSSPLGMFVYDGSGRCILANEAASRIIGAALPLILQQNFREIRSWKANGLLEAAEAALSNGTRQAREAHMVTTFSKEIWINATFHSFVSRGEIHLLLILENITERKKMEEMLRQLSSLDSLTGLGNRRLFDEVLNREWSRGARSGRPFSLLMLDIDHFKGYNDTYGHPAGDECLRKVGAVLKESATRPGDLAVRYGGEEFSVLLPTTDEEGALRVAEEIRAAVEALGIPHCKSQVGPFLTLSVGVATAVPPQGLFPSALVKNADQALYRAKDGGRNKVAVYTVAKNAEVA